MASKSPKQTTKVMLPPPTPEETQARERQDLLQGLQLQDAGYEFGWDENGKQMLRKLPPTAEQTADQEFEQKLKAYTQQRLLGGPVDPQTQALVGQVYDASRSKGTSQIDAFAREQAGAKGLDLTTDSPAMRESLMAKSNLETGLGGAQAASLLDQGNAQQIFAAQLNQFQQALQQQAFQNKSAMAGGYNQSAMQMAQIRGMSPTTRSTFNNGTTPFVGALNGFMQGLSNPMSGPMGLIGGTLGGALNSKSGG